MTPSFEPTFTSWNLPPETGELRLVPIGGLGEFGMNAMGVHTAKSLFLVDCGQLFPGDEQPGIDSVIPDFAYLEPFADQLDAVLLTHGHEDHIGALPYFLERWPVPVYGTRFTLGLVEGKLAEFDLGLEKLLHVVDDFDRVKIGCGEIEAEWIPVTHSIPGACAIALHTPMGVIVHTGDFKLDPSPVDGRHAGMKRFQELGDAGVDFLLSDSTNVLHAGHSPSESACREGLQRAFRETPGILFVATFSSNIHRVQLILDLAYEEGRKVCLVGRSLERNVATALRLKHLRMPDDLFIGVKEIHLFPRDQVVVLSTGSQGEHLSGLARMLREEVQGVRIKEGDRLIFSSRTIPGNDVAVSRMLDKAARQGAETVNQELGTIHATGHGYREELAEIIRVLRPRVMIPVHGNYRNLKVHGRLAQEMGCAPERVFLLDGGECLQIGSSGQVRIAGSVPVGKCFVDQGVDHHVDARVIRDRLILQEDGIVVATIQVDPESLELLADPAIITRGFVMLSEDASYAELLQGAVRRAYEDAPREIRANRELLVELLRQALRRVIRKTTQTRPLVVPMVLDA